MIIGTACFPSIEDACKYYLSQDFTLKDVSNMIEEGSISIGKPLAGPEYDVFLMTSQGGSLRYFLKSKR